MTVTDRDGLIDDRIRAQRLGFMIMYAMFGIAIAIAGFGVVNTLVLSVQERTREIGVARAVGATRRLIRRSIRTESIAITAFGGLLGVVTGLGVGAVMQHAMLGQDMWDVTVPWTDIAAALAGMVLIGVLGALWPARRPARTDVLAAIAAE